MNQVTVPNSARISEEISSILEYLLPPFWTTEGIINNELGLMFLFNAVHVFKSDDNDG